MSTPPSLSTRWSTNCFALRIKQLFAVVGQTGRRGRRGRHPDFVRCDNGPELTALTPCGTGVASARPFVGAGLNPLYEASAVSCFGAASAAASSSLNGTPSR